MIQTFQITKTYNYSGCQQYLQYTESLHNSFLILIFSFLIHSHFPRNFSRSICSLRFFLLCGRRLIHFESTEEVSPSGNPFGDNNAILLRGANSGQTSIKCRDIDCDVEPLPLRYCTTMTLEVKYLFPTLCSGTNFYIYQLPAGLGMRKILGHGIRMQKNSQTGENIFWTFTNFHGVMRTETHNHLVRKRTLNHLAKPFSSNSLTFRQLQSVDSL